MENNAGQPPGMTCAWGRGGDPCLLHMLAARHLAVQFFLRGRAKSLRSGRHQIRPQAFPPFLEKWEDLYQFMQKMAAALYCKALAAMIYIVHQPTQPP